MPKFKVVVEYQGYVRGQRTYHVEADTAEEAERNYMLGKRVDDEILRNDTVETGAVFNPENLDEVKQKQKLTEFENIINDWTYRK